MQLSKEEIKGLRHLWTDEYTWDTFEKFLRREHEVALSKIMKETDERALGKIDFIRNLLRIRDTGREMSREFNES